MDNKIIAIQIDRFFDKGDAVSVHRNGETNIYLNPTSASIKRIWNTDFTHMLENENMSGNFFAYYHLSL